jgi:hypothetical protein
MKSTLVLAALLVAFSSTDALSQTESTRSTTRRSAATAKKQSGSTKKSKPSTKKQTETPRPGSTKVAAETVTSTPRRSAPVAAPAAVTPVQSEAPIVVESRPIESWYGYYGVGFARPSYPGAMQSLADELSAPDGVINAGVAMDAAGVYAPYGGSTRLLVGGVVNLALDVYADETSSITMTQASVSSSALYFTSRIGEGPFVRGDVGLAAVSIANELEEGIESPVGVGVLAGAGYAMPLSNGTGLMLNVNYSARMIDGETFGAFGATVGILF